MAARSGSRSVLIFAPCLLLFVASEVLCRNSFSSCSKCNASRPGRLLHTAYPTHCLVAPSRAVDTECGSRELSMSSVSLL
uniref:Putative secreted protein n=1 Tax=Ixodes ricinus TaxID=34613 RepID=A0A6B0TVJ9_IXORI